MAASLVSFTQPAAGAGPTSGLRPVEELTRGVVAAETADGIFLSW